MRWRGTEIRKRRANFLLIPDLRLHLFSLNFIPGQSEVGQCRRIISKSKKFACEIRRQRSGGCCPLAAVIIRCCGAKIAANNVLRESCLSVLSTIGTFHVHRKALYYTRLISLQPSVLSASTGKQMSSNIFIPRSFLTTFQVNP